MRRDSLLGVPLVLFALVDIPNSVFDQDCGIRIDTAPGLPIAELRSEMIFRSPTPEDPRPIAFAPFVLESFEEDDVFLTGDLECTFASFGPSFF